MKFIDMDFEDALRRKWYQGVIQHRNGLNAPFNGDPIEELFQELIDAYAYVDVLEQDGVQLTGFKTNLKNMALYIQSRKEELKKRS